MKKDYLLTPGPTPIPPQVAAAMARPMIHHRTPGYREIFSQVSEALKTVFQTKHMVMTFTSSGTGAMESAVVNLLGPGDGAIVVTGGKFGERWLKLCERYGASVVEVGVPYGQAAHPAQVQDALKGRLNKGKGPKHIKAVFATLCETSTGVTHDIRAIGEIVHATDAVLVVDAISGLGADELKTDAWHCDVVVSGSQKGLMLPPGLAFASVSPKAWAVVERVKTPRFYFDWTKYRQALADEDTPFTPAISLVVALADAIRLIQTEGLPAVLARHARLAKATREAVAALGLQLFAERPSNAITAVCVPTGVDAKKLVTRMRDLYGVTITGGQGEMDGKIFRIAHVGYMERFDTIVAIAALEMALSDLGFPVTRGKGVAEAERILVEGNSKP